MPSAQHTYWAGGGAFAQGAKRAGWDEWPAAERIKMSFGTQAACDATQAHEAESRAETGHKTLVLITTILASSLSFIDGSVVNVGLPAIRHDLHGGAAAL